MSDAQVDMFEVQLGAGMLMQFRDRRGQPVRILADAGVTAKGYPAHHVLGKLPGAFARFSTNGTRRIDLVIGTHYDADHLEGLVPIIEDQSIEIGEAWMPPVANDTQSHALEDSVQDLHLLGHQFATEDGEERLARYLDAKRIICEQLAELERHSDALVAERMRPLSRVALPDFVTAQEAARSAPERGSLLIDYFRNHIADASVTLGEGAAAGHADEDILEPVAPQDVGRTLRVEPIAIREWAARLHSNPANRFAGVLDVWRVDPSGAGTHAKNLAFVRKSSAKDAINAISLANVVKALRARNIPTSYRMIEDGQPRRFIWVGATRRFEPAQHRHSDGPELLLLGPSESLVKKHWHRLPIGDYIAALAFAPIPVKSITPSNQLSYVTRIGFQNQGILVSGDAGFVDFKADRKTYYPQLLNSLLPLHVIQVAHHAGNNAHFYRALLEAGYAQQKDESLLLLSHATNDKHRPSKEFGMFIEQVRNQGDDIKLLFTSRPDPVKVKDFPAIIHPVVGEGGTVGDIRLALKDGRWSVEAHAVAV